MALDDELLFAEDEGALPAPEPTSPRVWKLAVIDDETAIHDVTRLALGGVRVERHPLAVLTAHSDSPVMSKHY